MSMYTGGLHMYGNPDNMVFNKSRAPADCRQPAAPDGADVVHLRCEPCTGRLHTNGSPGGVVFNGTGAPAKIRVAR
jgi:hypothetical protein